MRRVFGLFASSVRRQLLSSFGLVVLLLAVFAIITYSQMDRVRNYAQDITPLREQIGHQQSFGRVFASLQANLDQYLLTTSSQSQQDCRNDLAALRAALESIRGTELDQADPELDALVQVVAQQETEVQRLLDVDLKTLSAAEQNQYIVSVYSRLDATDQAQQASLAETLKNLNDVSNRQQSIISSLVALFVVMVVIVIGLAVLLALVISGYIAGPLSSMASTVSRFASGELESRVAVNTARQDEVGRLAVSFNDMAAQLHDLLGSLEARVQARTKDLQLAAQVSEQVASILDVEQLLPQVVELTRENFSLYHAHIYLLDETGGKLVLAAGAGEAGRIMKASKHSISAQAERSLVARAARDNNPVIVDDVVEEPGFLPNPLLPNTRSEAAFPLAVGQRVFGVLDVQSEQVARFDVDLLAVLSTLAGQVGVALANARLFSEVERTSRHEQALGNITQRIQQATTVDDVLQTVVRELGVVLRVPHTAIELRLPTHDAPVTAALPVRPGAAEDPDPAADLSGVQS